MKKYKYHYVYKITNIVLNKHYYGSRSCNCDPTLDIGNNYFSSSTDQNFISLQKKNPSYFEYKIVGVFTSTRTEAIKMEVFLHKYYNVKNNPSFYNKANQTMTGFMFDTNGIPKTETHRKKISDSLKGIEKSESHCKKISKAILKKFDTDPSYKKRLSDITKKWHETNTNPFKGKKHSVETRKKMSENHADFRKEKHPQWGTSPSKEARKKMSDAKKGKGLKPHNSKHLLLISPEGKEYRIFGSLQKFCDEHNLGVEAIRQIYTKGIKPVRKKNRNYGWDVKVLNM